MSRVHAAGSRAVSFGTVEAVRHTLERVNWKHDLAVAVTAAMDEFFDPTTREITTGPSVAWNKAIATLILNPEVREAILRAHRWHISARDALHLTGILSENPEHGDESCIPT